MINPNEKHAVRGKVIKVCRRNDGSILNIAVLLDSGAVVESVLGLDHKTLKEDDYVFCQIGFRIMGDKYVLEGVRRSKAV